MACVGGKQMDGRTDGRTDGMDGWMGGYRWMMQAIINK